MTETELISSIDDILSKKLTKGNIRKEWLPIYDHPKYDDNEIRKAIRLSVFGRLAGIDRGLKEIHIVNRLFAFWTIVYGVAKMLSPWDSIRSDAIDGTVVLMYDHPRIACKFKEIVG
jgi:hypothetical protein